MVMMKTMMHYVYKSKKLCMLYCFWNLESYTGEKGWYEEKIPMRLKYDPEVDASYTQGSFFTTKLVRLWLFFACFLGISCLDCPDRWIG